MVHRGNIQSGNIVRCVVYTTATWLGTIGVLVLVYKRTVVDLRRGTNAPTAVHTFAAKVGCYWETR